MPRGQAYTAGSTAALASWKALTIAERKAQGLPSSDAEYAQKILGISTRGIQKRMQDPEFRKMVDELRENKAKLAKAQEEKQAIVFATVGKVNVETVSDAEAAAMRRKSRRDDGTLPDAVVKPKAPEKVFPTVKVDESLSDVELMAQLVRSQLIAAQQPGPDGKEARDFLKNAAIAKPLIDKVNAEVESDFPDKTDDELIDMIIDSFGLHLVRRLTDRGLLL